MKTKLSIFILVLTLQSCLNVTDPMHQAQYIAIYKAFDNKLVSHFPKKMPNNWVATSYSSPENVSEYMTTAELCLSIQIPSKEKFEELKKQLKKEAKVIKNSFDSCLLLVDSKENENSKNCNGLYPIPQQTIYDFDEMGNPALRLENTEVALLDYKSGKFLENKNLKAKETLPENWKNGYSKGYAFNNKEQIIMYWLIIW